MRKNKKILKMPSKGQNAEVSDTTNDHSSNAAGKIISI
jgi:hypothetical protein